MIIRKERPSDIEAICEVTKAAFDYDAAGCRTEHLTIRDLRTAGALSISLVSEIKGRIVGHIAFSPVCISDGTTGWYGLGPASVLPDFQGLRIGTALVRKGLARLKSMGGKGCTLVGLPTYYERFGFKHHPRLILEGIPRELFVATPFYGLVPRGTVEFHQAFKQLSVIEKETIADAIIDFDLNGIRLDPGDPAVQRLMEKNILTEMPDGRLMLQAAALASYDTYFSKVTQFRRTEMSRVHKNPLLTAITSGISS